MQRKHERKILCVFAVRHKHKHLGIKRYQCSYCQYRADQRWLLVNHTAKQHGVQMEKVISSPALLTRSFRGCRGLVRASFLCWGLNSNSHLRKDDFRRQVLICHTQHWGQYNAKLPKNPVSQYLCLACRFRATRAAATSLFATRNGARRCNNSSNI